jgi:hypothetical protein
MASRRFWGADLVDHLVRVVRGIPVTDERMVNIPDISVKIRRQPPYAPLFLKDSSLSSSIEWDGRGRAVVGQKIRSANWAMGVLRYETFRNSEKDATQADLRCSTKLSSSQSGMSAA